MALTDLDEHTNNMYVLFIQSCSQIFCMPDDALAAFRNSLLC